MNWALFLQLFVTTIVAFCGAYLAHLLSARRDRANARRDRRIEFLIDAYRKLEFISNRASLDDAAPIEKAIADIQLFGSAKQVQAAQAFVSEFAATRSASLDILLEELRKDLRAELQLEHIPGKLLFLRWTLPPKSDGKKPVPRSGVSSQGKF